jgi:uncharacterized membrane protein
VDARTTAVDRIAPFSDGVFAIAITLLIIEIGVPGEEVSGSELTDALTDLVPQFFSFVFSFLVIGRYWIAHHLMFDVVERRTTALLWLNLALLLCIAFLPFPSALLGEHLDDPAAVAVYAAAMCATGVASTALWAYIARTNAVERREAATTLRRAASVPIVFGLSIPAAFVDLGALTLATVLWIVALPLAAIIRRAT